MKKAIGDDERDNAAGSDGPGWLEACRREESIRKLLGRSDGERLKMGDVEEVALELESVGLSPHHGLSSNADRRGARAETEKAAEESAPFSARRATILLILSWRRAETASELYHKSWLLNDVVSGFDAEALRVSPSISKGAIDFLWSGLCRKRRAGHGTASGGQLAARSS